MNRKEWGRACSEGWAPRRYDNASREIQRSLKYNPDPNAVVRHHLRDTEEQRKYNDEHYELWGFEIDENGNEHFEYGKYIIFITPDEHSEIHSYSEETRKKMSESAIATWNDTRRRSYSNRMTGSGNHQYGKFGALSPNYGVKRSDETRIKMSETLKEQWSDGRRNRSREISNEEHTKRSNAASGENNGMYGKHHTEEAKNRMSKNSRKSMLGKHHTEESKAKLSEAHKRDNLSDYTRQELSRTSKEIHTLRKQAYINYIAMYKDNQITYKEFSHLYNNGRWKEFLD